MLNGNDHDECETRQRQLLAQLAAMSQRVARLEADQQEIVEILVDIRDLLRMMRAHLRTLDGRLDRVDAWLLPVAGHSERVARHLRN